MGMTAPSEFDANGEPTEAVTLKLSVDGSSGFQFRLTDENDVACFHSAFSDEKGIIFEGTAIGCPGR